MSKVKKGLKIHNRVRTIKEKTLFDLYNNLPIECQSCVYNSNCPKIEKMSDVTTCDIYERMIDLNDLIEIMREQNINMDAFCNKWDLKKEFFTEMIKGKMLMNYKYYVALCERLHLKDYDEFEKYKYRFLCNNGEDDKDGVKF